MNYETKNRKTGRTMRMVEDVATAMIEHRNNVIVVHAPHGDDYLKPMLLKALSRRMSPWTAGAQPFRLIKDGVEIPGGGICRFRSTRCKDVIMDGRNNAVQGHRGQVFFDHDAVLFSYRNVLDLFHKYDEQ